MLHNWALPLEIARMVETPEDEDEPTLLRQTVIWRSATDAEPHKKLGPASIFDIVSVLSIKRVRLTTCKDSGKTTKETDGTKTVEGCRYPMARDQDERELIRREKLSKLKPPKPPKTAITRGRKIGRIYTDWDDY